MKNIIASALLLGLAGSANATTVLAGGGTGGAQFFTSTGTILTNTNSSFRVGLLEGGLFTPFATADATPIVISTVVALAGRWSAGVTDNSASATPFNGKTIWFEVTTTADGGGSAYFSGASNFPTNGGGAADSITVDSKTLLTLGAGSSVGSAAYNSGTNKITIGTIPEPSAALLGAIGALGLLRRRRN